jgi:hypothetical protein
VGAIIKPALVTTMDMTNIMAIIIKVMAVITGAIKITGGMAATTETAITIATPSVVITTDAGITIPTGLMRHTITTMDTEWPFLSLIPASVSDSA